MFSKKIENNIIDYIIVSPIEEIFINVLVDDNHFIVQTNITYVLLEDKKDIYAGHKILDITSYKGVLGFHNAINDVIVYILEHMEERMYFENDIYELITTSAKDFSELEKKCAIANSKEGGFFGNNKGFVKWKKEYHNE